MTRCLMVLNCQIPVIAVEFTGDDKVNQELMQTCNPVYLYSESRAAGSMRQKVSGQHKKGKMCSLLIDPVYETIQAG